VPERAAAYADANLKVNELLYRRVDVEDVVSSHLLAMDRAPAIGFGRFIVTATTPFRQEDLPQLGSDAPGVLARYFPEFASIYARLGWKMLPRLDRVYVNARARELLGWQPRYDFAHALRCVAAGREYRSAMTLRIGSKGYHQSR
jgi:UDP-glucose 4-epimerase